MPWVESSSRFFRARHDADESDAALRMLDALERTRERLLEHFPRPLGELTVVIHHRTASLWLARPPLALAWARTAPAARRYLVGGGNAHELHVLGERALSERASAVAGSREMMRLAVPALYARHVVMLNNRELQSAVRTARPVLALRWAWLLEGAARWFAGQTEYARPAIARRLREDREPKFPPSARDAPLLGGTVIDLLVRERGERAAAQLACRLHPGGARAALTGAFDGRSVVHTEGAWRAHMARLATAS